MENYITNIEAIADDEVFVLVVDSDHSYISHYGKCTTKTDRGYELKSKDPCESYTILIEKVIDNRLQFVEETFIMNPDRNYSNKVFQQG